MPHQEGQQELPQSYWDDVTRYREAILDGLPLSIESNVIGSKTRAVFEWEAQEAGSTASLRQLKYRMLGFTSVQTWLGITQLENNEGLTHYLQFDTAKQRILRNHYEVVIAKPSSITSDAVALRQRRKFENTTGIHVPTMSDYTLLYDELKHGASHK